MKTKTYLTVGASVAAFALSGSFHASAAPKASASPAASASAATSASPAASAAKAARPTPFRGSATSVDQSTKTFTIVGKKANRVFKVTDKTVISKAGSAATMADLTENEAVAGSYWKQEDGTLEAKTLKIGAKTNGEKSGSRRKSKKAAKAEETSSESAATSPSPSPK